MKSHSTVYYLLQRVDQKINQIGRTNSQYLDNLKQLVINLELESEIVVIKKDFTELSAIVWFVQGAGSHPKTCSRISKGNNRINNKCIRLDFG